MEKEKHDGAFKKTLLVGNAFCFHLSFEGVLDLIQTAEKCRSVYFCKISWQSN